jgi:hypothetical protein
LFIVMMTMYALTDIYMVIYEPIYAMWMDMCTYCPLRRKKIEDGAVALAKKLLLMTSGIHSIISYHLSHIRTHKLIEQFMGFFILKNNVECFLQEKFPHFCKNFSPGTGGEILCQPQQL